MWNNSLPLLVKLEVTRAKTNLEFSASKEIDSSRTTFKDGAYW